MSLLKDSLMNAEETKRGTDMNSREKGKRGELELAHELTKWGYKTRRGQQFAGANGDADVVGIPGLHIECKRVEQLNLEKALDQSEHDARIGEYAVVMHRRNRERWKVTMSLEQFMALWKKWEKINDKGRTSE